MKRRLLRILAIFVACFSLVLVACTSTACNDRKNFSDEIFIYDYSETYRISVRANVRHHLMLPADELSFEYSKGIDKLYDEILSKVNPSCRMVGDLIVVDLEDDLRTYSCVIRKRGDVFAVQNLTCRLGKSAEDSEIFFPEYTLDRPISDGENSTYVCEMGIDALKEYYVRRGYFAEIRGNVLHVVCTLRYPEKFFEDDYRKKALSWDVVYESENALRFENPVNDYVW